jgi:hypothetical protein
MLRLGDDDFKRVVSSYSKYGDFRSDLDNESGVSILKGGAQYWVFSDLQEKILKRYDDLI